jgi:phosphoribosyl 1,2-cyclic phosphodiesterase
MELIVLGSGSSGNSAVLRAHGTTLLLDAGLSARTTLARLASVGIGPEEIDAILLTHEHGDHARGLPVLLRSLRCPVYATRLTMEDLGEQDARNLAATWRIFATGSTFDLGAVSITAFSVPHDAADPVGFTIRSEQASVAVLTDLGHANHSVIHHATGVNCLFIEANHDEQMLHADSRRPFSVKQRILSSHGHLSNRAAAELVLGAMTDSLRRVVLGHLSRDCNSPELAVNTVRQTLVGRTDVHVCCAGPDEMLPPLSLGR